WALAAFFGLQGMEAYVIIGWSAQYLRDSGLSAAGAGVMLGVNSVVGIPLSAVIPTLTVRPRLQRPLLAFFVTCYVAGWLGLWLPPPAPPRAWVAPTAPAH